jgi:hypothetical protein
MARGKTNWTKYDVPKRAKRLDKFEEFKRGLSCCRCGLAHPAVLQFHHRDPSQKLFGVAQAVYNRGWETIMIEVAKCDVLCANCHAIHHWEERQAKKQAA